MTRSRGQGEGRRGRAIAGGRGRYGGEGGQAGRQAGRTRPGQGLGGLRGRSLDSIGKPVARVCATLRDGGPSLCDAPASRPKPAPRLDSGPSGHRPAPIRHRETRPVPTCHWSAWTVDLRKEPRISSRLRAPARYDVAHQSTDGDKDLGLPHRVRVASRRVFKVRTSEFFWALLVIWNERPTLVYLSGACLPVLPAGPCAISAAWRMPRGWLLLLTWNVFCARRGSHHRSRGGLR